jgi:phage tail sheath protein FI
VTGPGLTAPSRYRTPGVRIELLDSGDAGAVPERTDITGFVGVADRGPLHRPVRTESWEQFRGEFGGHRPDSYLAYAVEGFFANGGSTCWVVRVADPETARAAEAALPFGTLTAASPGSWGDRIRYDVRPDAAVPARFTLTLRLADVVERWRNLTFNPVDPAGRDPAATLNDPSTGSRLVWLTVPAGAVAPSAALAGQLTGGVDGLAGLRPAHFAGDNPPSQRPWGVAALEAIDEISIVAIPDVWTPPVRATAEPSPRPVDCGREEPAPVHEPLPAPVDPRSVFDTDTVRELLAEVVARCERRGDRVALLDAPTGELVDPPAVLAFRSRLDSGFGALYYPWIRVVDPLSPTGDVLAVPPSGHVAGGCAHGDRTVGVHKPPAGADVALAVDVVATVDDADHGTLNDVGVNVLRADGSVRVLGARTVSNDPAWRFLNVRRLMIHIERTIVRETRFAVFEPNGPRLWARVGQLARAVLEDLWRRGMLDGATRTQAYGVICDATVNPPEDVAAGKLVCTVSVRPPPPAEVVVIRVVRTAGGSDA